ncbi:MAG: hypothetical protein AAF587_21865, partial [Bacteroidota bacterium]
NQEMLLSNSSFPYTLSLLVWVKLFGSPNFLSAFTFCHQKVARSPKNNGKEKVYGSEFYSNSEKSRRVRKKDAYKK